jgi:hypothetical protein
MKLTFPAFIFIIPLDQTLALLNGYHKANSTKNHMQSIVDIPK